MRRLTAIRPNRGFSLVEILVSLVILTFILLIVFETTNQIGRAWKGTSAKIEAFRNARIAFETMTSSLSHATLNTFYDYYDSTHQRPTSATAATFTPAYYGRYSDLEFISGKSLVTLPRTQVTHAVFFQSPVSYTQQPGTYSHLNNLLNTVGFYIEFYNDGDNRPAFFGSLASSPPVRWRYRLMQLLQPTENFSLYTISDASWWTKPAGNALSWFTTPLAISPNSTNPAPCTRLLAENIIACAICPKLPTDTTGSTLAPLYEYDSRDTTSWTTGGNQPASMHQVPPIVRVVLIAADEPSMLRIQGNGVTPPNLGINYAQIFQKAANLETDLTTIGNALTALHINFRIFRTDVAVHEANWSQ